MRILGISSTRSKRATIHYFSDMCAVANPGYDALEDNDASAGEEEFGPDESPTDAD